MTALATRPDDLRLAARTLLGAAAELSEAGQRLRRAEAESASGWQGVAALGQRLATQRVATAVLARCGPAEQVAGALGVFAGQAEQAQVVVRAAQGARDDATAERIRQIGLLRGASDAPVIEAIRERIVALEQVIRRADDEINWAEEKLEQGRSAVDRMLRDSWFGLGIEELRDLIEMGKEVAPVVRGGGLVIVGTRVVLTTAKLARELSPLVRFALDAKLARLLKVVRKPPIIFLLSKLPFRVLIPLTVIPSAFEDLRTGGGYTGVQGFALRASAAVAIPGSLAMVLPNPLVAGLGAVSVGIYYAAKGGLAIWDHRIFLSQVGAIIHRERRKIYVTAKELLRHTPYAPLGPLGPIKPPPAVREALRDLPTLPDLGRWLPVLGGPLAIPRVPIAPGPRLPVVPPPTLTGVGVGIVLPTLRKLF